MALERLNMMNAKKLLSNNTEFQFEIDLDDSHSCESCEFSLKQSLEGSDIFENLEAHLSALKEKNDQLLYAMINVAGYVFKDVDLTEEELLNCTTYYYNDYNSYQNDFDKGFLKIPTDTMYEFCTFGVILFSVETLLQSVCRNSCIKILNEINKFYDFNVSEKCMRTLANIILSKYAKKRTPYSQKEIVQKKLKLSD